jgi:hypothetical protein
MTQAGGSHLQRGSITLKRSTHFQPWGAPCLPAFGKRGISLEEQICPLWVQGVVIVDGPHFSQETRETYG